MLALATIYTIFVHIFAGAVFGSIENREFKYPQLDWRLSLSGGVAGGMSNAIIYPIGILFHFNYYIFNP